MTHVDRHESPVDRGSGDPAVSQSTLGANLNELDYLLQDLNSAQFLNDMSGSATFGMITTISTV